MRISVLRLLSEFLRFIGAGFVGVALYYAVFFTLTESGVWYIASAVFASLASFGAQFALQKYWTFKKRGTSEIRRQMGAYLIWSAASFVLNLALLYFFVEYLGLWYFTAQVVSTIALTPLGYVVSRRIFRS